MLTLKERFYIDSVGTEAVPEMNAFALQHHEAVDYVFGYEATEPTCGCGVARLRTWVRYPFLTLFPRAVLPVVELVRK